MLTRGDYLMIIERRAQGAYIKDIAAELGVHRKTVSRALKRGSEPPRRPSRRCQRPRGCLDPTVPPGIGRGSSRGAMV